MKIAIVTPWFGRDLKGGAEQHAWQLAARFASRGHAVEVLTTCCRSHQDDWEKNHFAEGSSVEAEGFLLHRFNVSRRDVRSFNAVNTELLATPRERLIPGVSPVSDEKARVFVSELIKSPDLLSFIEQNRTNYDRLLFLPYLYGPVILGVALAGERAVLVPCLHDEAYAYLPQVAETFYRAGSILFISEGEQELAVRLFGPGIAMKCHFAGAGVESKFTEARPDRLDLPGKFLLYLGRKDPGKNVPLLINAFRRFRRVRPNSQLHLVLAGHGTLESNGCKTTIDLGLVSDEDKNELLDRCVAVVQPSANESFSRVMLEGWLHHKPVAVHQDCMATAFAVDKAEGGWTATDERSWADLCVAIDRASEEEMSRLGSNGRKYAELLGGWDSVMNRYEEILLPKPVDFVPQVGAEGDFAINQFLPNLSYGDAISNEAIFIRDYLRRLGFQSDIYVRSIDPRLPPGQCQFFSEAALKASDAAIYHHSIGTDITPHLIQYAGPKCLIYHNITPARFIEPYRPEFADLLARGRRHLGDLAAEFKISYGDSRYNADELAACGFVEPEVLPICVAPKKWAFSPDSELMRSLSDGRTNLVFVGRVAPNKKQEDLVRTFAHYLKLDPNARLFLLGTIEPNDPYTVYLTSLIKYLGLENSVYLPGGIADSQLAAYYSTADLFCSMSEHEGFLVPVIEAMWFDVPVIAFHSSAVPETLGEAGLTFTDKSDLTALAALAFVLVNDRSVRRSVIRAQRRQRERFLPDRIAPLLDRLVDRLLRDSGATNLRRRITKAARVVA